MPLNGTEMGLIVLIASMAGVGGGKIWGSKGKVTESQCGSNHVAHTKEHKDLDKYLDVKFGGVEKSLDEIKGMLRGNGHGQ